MFRYASTSNINYIILCNSTANTQEQFEDGFIAFGATTAHVVQKKRFPRISGIFRKTCRSCRSKFIPDARGNCSACGDTRE